MKRGNAGFTLAEVMLATGLSVLLTAVMITGFYEFNRWTSTISQHVSAFALCQDRLDRIRATPYGAISITNANMTAGAVIITRLSGSSRLPVYGVLSNNIVAGTNYPPSKMITVILNWTNQGRVQREILGTTLFDKKGQYQL